ncbi:MAG: GntG family PLP-dependent aldolase [Actinomycetota bacterium]|nr:GntG family PLP-dependent aldolase [Actinomycetota bacterium]
MIDLRSDTVTRPSAAMRSAMASAPVGDDVLGDDPTVIQLEERVAELLGKEDAVYVPSGTMANQIALRLHTRSGDRVVMDGESHIRIHESGAPAALAGVTIVPLEGDRGVFSAEQVVDAAPGPSPDFPPGLFDPTTLVTMENTHNEAGGTIWPLDTMRSVSDTATDLGLAVHLDGARLWNATAATGVALNQYADTAETVNVCFSKGLGAPIGSALAGPREVIDRGRWFKKMYGGGFRQAGIIAAGALYALEHNRDRLVDDHTNARRFAEAAADLNGLSVDLESVQTNMVFFDAADASRFAEHLRSAGVDTLALGPTRIRAVFHLDVSDTDTTRAIEILRDVTER